MPSPSPPSLSFPIYHHLQLVEDNVANRIATHQLLLALGCFVTVVDSARGAMSELTNRKGASQFDVVLLDMCMPEVDGFQVAKHIGTTFR